MSVFSPTASYQAELRQELDGVKRVLLFQRAVRWGARGLAVGLLADLALVAWLWSREAVPSFPPPLYTIAPVLLALLTAIAATVRRPGLPELARRVDTAAGLQERAITALELGGTGVEHPLALVQLRDAVEHLKRVETLDVFPVGLPRAELAVSLLTVLAAAAVAFAPNPWAIRARQTNPAIASAREQAQRVERAADAIQGQDPEVNQLRDLLQKSAKTIEAKSNDPEAALGALEDLEQQLQQLSAGDDAYAAALAAAASALAGDPTTSDLAAAINTGDLREVSRAAKDLAQKTQQMDGQTRERVSKLLRDAADKAAQSSPTAASQLAQAASALAGGDQQGSVGQGGSQSASQAGAQGAQDALNNMSQSANAAAERQGAQGQVDSSRNALERALGRSASRSGSGNRSNGSGQQNGQGQGQQSQGQGQGQGGQSGAGDQQGQGGSGDQQGNGNGQQGDQGNDGQPGGGAGKGNVAKTGDESHIDTISSAQQDSDGNQVPDVSSANPYTGQAADGSSKVGDQQVQPNYGGGPSQSGGDNGSIPVGLRDLVKDYFSSIDGGQGQNPGQGQATSQGQGQSPSR